MFNIFHSQSYCIRLVFFVCMYTDLSSLPWFNHILALHSSKSNGDNVSSALHKAAQLSY